MARRALLLLLAQASASIVLVEVLLTRLLSVASWYSLAFVVLSIAMLGLTRGSLEALAAVGTPLRPWLASRFARFAAGLLTLTAVVCLVPLRLEADPASVAAIALAALAAAWPMVTGGSIVARLMGETELDLGSLYAADLGAAALGALLPLVLLGPLSGPAAMVVVALLAALTSVALANAPPRAALTAVALGVLLLTQLTPYGLTIRHPKGRAEGVPAGSFEVWNALSQVVLAPLRPEPAFYWGASRAAPRVTVRQRTARIDGDAGTPVVAWRTLGDLAFLRYDVTAAAHWLRPGGLACVIGVGGGRDVLTALSVGHPRAVGIEINPGIGEMLEHVAPDSPLVRDPRFRLVIGDGRAELGRLGERCAVLQASLVDTWAATAAGAFAHSEATLYTREAWGLFLDRVEPDGVLTFSRWHVVGASAEVGRLVALASSALRDRGVREPWRHIVMVRSLNIATILVSPAPFTPRDLAAVHHLNAALGYDVLLAPDRPADDSVPSRVVRAPDDAALRALGASLGFDATPPTDDRPFFFHVLPASAWWHPIDAGRNRPGHPSVPRGALRAMRALLLTFGVVALLGAALLGPTLARAARSRDAALPCASSGMYFAALGAGFMLVEVALVQRMHVVLGHPTYALVGVLAALLVASGAGSFVSARVVRSLRGVAAAAMAGAVALALLPGAVIGPLARATAGSSLGVRVAWTSATAMAVGLVLGMLFPSGLRFVQRARGVPLALAINGATSVLGSVAALVISLLYGIPRTLGAAAAVYALAGLCAWDWSRRATRAPSGVGVPEASP
jgi:hypothetical protein